MLEPSVHAPARATRGVVRSYGSAPGELAACLRHVGLVQRGDLAAVPIAGAPAAIEAASADLIGHALAVGGCVRVAGTWWSRPDARTLLIAGAPDAVARATGLLRTQTRRRCALALGTDVELVAMSVIGLHTATLLDDLGVLGPLGDLRVVSPCVPSAIGGALAVWLLESDTNALCVVDRTDAEVVEQRIALAGRPLRLARVGHDALAQYLLLERRRASGALRPPA